MLLTILGSGTAIPVPDRFPAGYLLQTQTAQVLIDCGPGVLRRLAQLPQLEPFRGHFRAFTARNSSNHKGCSREWRCSANPPR